MVLPLSALDLFGMTGFCAAVDDVGAEVIAIIALVSDESAHRWRRRKKGRSGNDICVLPGSEMKCARSAGRIGPRVDFRGASAA